MNVAGDRQKDTHRLTQHTDGILRTFQNRMRLASRGWWSILNMAPLTASLTSSGFSSSAADPPDAAFVVPLERFLGNSCWMACKNTFKWYRCNKSRYTSLIACPYTTCMNILKPSFFVPRLWRRVAETLPWQEETASES